MTRKMQEKDEWKKKEEEEKKLRANLVAKMQCTWANGNIFFFYDHLLSRKLQKNTIWPSFQQLHPLFDSFL